VQKSEKIVCNQVYHFIISVRLMKAGKLNINTPIASSAINAAFTAITTTTTITG
jgi:hypothetical protein